MNVAKPLPFLALAIISLLSACSIGKKQPLWTTQHPVDIAYYNSVVRVSRKAPNYLDLARDNALKEISNQISVTIDADIALRETETNGIPSAEIINQIRTSTRSKLANVQLAGSFQDDTEYWAYYRLSKSEYLAWRMTQRDLAIQQALPLLDEFDKATIDLAPAITALFRAMELIIDFSDLDLRTSYQGKTINLYNELFQRISKLPAMINMSYETANLSLVAMQKELHIIPVDVIHDKDGQRNICRGFPVVFNFRGGAGDIVRNSLTDNNGKAELLIRRITDFTDPQFIEMRPDKDYWQSRLENPVVKKLLAQLQFAPTPLKLNVRRPRAFVDYSFDNSPGAGYKDLIIKKLQDLDLEVVADSSASDFTFKVIIVSQDGDYVSRLQLMSASADAYVELLQSKGYKSLYNTNLTGIKGTGSDQKTALKMTELNSAAEICDKLLYMIVEQHIMR